MNKYAFALITLLLAILACNKKKEGEQIKAKKHIILLLDAAHGGSDTGKTANGKLEKTFVPELCNKVMKLVQDYNVDEVRLTRTEDGYMEPGVRQDIANAVEADALISVHINKSSTATFRPYEIFVVPSGLKEIESKLLARAILADLKAKGKDTLLTGMSVLTLNRCRHTAISIECGDMGNAVDVAYMEDGNGLCRQLLRSLVAYANVQ